MKEIEENLEEILIKLMHESKWNRNSDYALYADYIRYCKPEINSSRYYEVMSNHKEYGIASFKAVERQRRKIQEKARKNGDKLLLSDKIIEKYREELEEEYYTKYASKERTN